MRQLLVAFCTQLLRIFFRRIEVVGQPSLPASGAIVFAANHPNGLVDPLLLLCLAGRPVSFLAKEPLFRTPLIGYFVRNFECLPVYRSQDGGDPAKNRAVMQQAVALLERGNALGLFPEGVSHSEPELKPFKTGAARLALSAAGLGTSEVWLVPVFLYYEQKQVFRSRAVVAYGPALPVPRLELDAAGDAPREAARELTTRLREAVGRIAPTAASVDALLLAEQAERVLDVDALAHGAVRPSLAERMALRRRLLEAYASLQPREPESVDQLVARLRSLAQAFANEGLTIDATTAVPRFSSGRWWLRASLATALLLPASVGVLLHAPAYHLIKYLAQRYSGQETDVVATAKLLGGVLLFPASWLLCAGAAALTWGWLGFITVGCGAPLTGLLALTFLEFVRWLFRAQGGHGKVSPEDFEALTAARARLVADMRQLLDADDALSPAHPGD